MATTTTISKILFRRGNDSDRKKTILASGEPGFTLDTKRLWIGDGVTPGGYPALSGRDTHLHYISSPPNGVRWTTQDKDHVNVGAESLDINVPGLAHTLAGEPLSDWIEYSERGEAGYRWFHPVEKDIRTNKNIYMESATSEIQHTGGTTLKIESNGDIAIGEALYIRKNSDGSKRVDIDVGDDEGMIRLIGEKQIFDNGIYTHFEDASIDFNVGYKEVGGMEDPGDGPVSNDAGIYIAHRNYLSAGFVKIGHEGDEFGFSTMEISPTVYQTNWEDYGILVTEELGTQDTEYPKNPTTRAGVLKNLPNDSLGDNGFEGGPDTGTITYGWQGPTTRRDGRSGIIGNDRTPKSLMFQSVRPKGRNADPSNPNETVPYVDWRNKSYEGNAHLIFESGLIVYDAGDPETGAYNAYKINQSVDTRSFPVFRGIKIENPDGTPGAPMPVRGGGTGVNDFNAGGVIYTQGLHGDSATEADLKSMPLELGQITVGTNSNGVVRTEIIPVDPQALTGPRDDDYLKITYKEPTSTDNGFSSGVIRIANNFSPEAFAAGTKADERFTWFGGFGTINTDYEQIRGTGTPGKPKEDLRILGDWNSEVNIGGNIRVHGNSSAPDSQQIFMLHNHLAHYAYEKAKAQQPSPETHNTLPILEAIPGTSEGDGLGSIDNTRVVTLLAGMTDSEGYFGSLIPSDEGTSADDIRSGYRNNGLVIGGVTINRQGHVVGVRSKDFDERYALSFNIGTKTRRDSEDAIYRPVDYNSVMTSRAVKTGSAAWESVLQSQSEGMSNYSSAAYARYVGGTDSLLFNDYGTVHATSQFNINDYFYDKIQVSGMMEWANARMDAHDSSLLGLGGTAFLRDKDTETLVELETTWNRKSKISFSGEARSNKSSIWSDDSLVYFDVHSNKSVISTLEGDNKRFEWKAKRKGTTTFDKLMQIGNNLSDDMFFALYHNDAECLSMSEGVLKISTTSGTSAETILTGNKIETTTGVFNGTVTVEGELKLGSDTGAGYQDSVMSFFDDRSNLYSETVIYSSSNNRFEISSGLYVNRDNGSEHALIANGPTQIRDDLFVDADQSIGGKLTVAQQIVAASSIQTGSYLSANATSYLAGGARVGASGKSGSFIDFYDTRYSTNRRLEWNATAQELLFPKSVNLTGGGLKMIGDLTIGSSVNKDPSINFYDSSSPDNPKSITYDYNSSRFDFERGIDVSGGGIFDGTVTAKDITVGPSSTQDTGIARITFSTATGSNNYLEVDTGINSNDPETFRFSNNLLVSGKITVTDSIEVTSPTGAVYSHIIQGDQARADCFKFGDKGEFGQNTGVVDWSKLRLWHDTGSKNDYIITDIQGTEHYLLHSGNFNTHMGDYLTSQQSDARYMPVDADVRPDDIYVYRGEDAPEHTHSFYPTFIYEQAQGESGSPERLYGFDHFRMTYSSSDSNRIKMHMREATVEHQLVLQTNPNTPIGGAGMTFQLQSDENLSGEAADKLFQPLVFGSTIYNTKSWDTPWEENTMEGYSTHINIAQNGDYGIGHAAATLYYTSWDAHAWYGVGINSSTGLRAGGLPEDGGVAKQRMMLLTTNGSNGLEDGLYVAGNITGYYDFSDERLKTNVVDIDQDEALQLVNNLQGVRYDWKDGDKERQIGLIAQQVEEHVPEVVRESTRLSSIEEDDMRYKQVDYDKIVPLLIESVKTLTKRVEELESQLK